MTSKKKPSRRNPRAIGSFIGNWMAGIFGLTTEADTQRLNKKIVVVQQMTKLAISGVQANAKIFLTFSKIVSSKFRNLDDKFQNIYGELNQTFEALGILSKYVAGNTEMIFALQVYLKQWQLYDTINERIDNIILDWELALEDILVTPFIVVTRYVAGDY